MSLIWLLSSHNLVKLVSCDKTLISTIWFPQRLNSVRLMQYSIPLRLLIPIPEASSTPSKPASSTSVIGCPPLLPSSFSSLIRKLLSGMLTISPTAHEHTTSSFETKFPSMISKTNVASPDLEKSKLLLTAIEYWARNLAIPLGVPSSLVISCTNNHPAFISNMGRSSGI